MVIRKILSVLVGIVAGMLVIGLVEELAHRLFPVPQEMMQMDENQPVEAMLALISPSVLLMALLAYILGSCVAGIFAAWLGNSLNMSVVSGLVLMLGGIIHVMMIPNPFWFVMMSMVVFLPFSWFGGWLVLKYLKKLPEKTQ